MPHVPIEKSLHDAVAHQLAGRLSEAEAIYRRILSHRPDHAQTLYCLGMIAAQTGRADQAIDLTRRAVAAAPGDPMFHSSLGILLQGRGQVDEAIACYQRALRIRADFVDAHYNLGTAWVQQCQFDAAIACFQRAVDLRPDIAEFHYNLANAFKEKRNFAQAAAGFLKAIALRPDYVDAHNNLGTALQGLGQMEQAMASYRAVISLKPDDAGGYSNLGNAWKDIGQYDKAIACYKKALALQGDFVAAHDNLLYVMNFDPACDARGIHAEFLQWNRRHAQPLKNLIGPHDNDRNPDRPLRVGYVSPNFNSHPVGRFMLPLLAAHDRRNVEVFCYAQVPVADEFTAKAKSLADSWRNIVGRSDEQVARMIREDKIDILVDLAMHTADSRLLVFARKPAPVQVTYLAYAGGTALDAIDYRLTDRYLDPDPANDQYYMEKSIRLEGTYWCYEQTLANESVNELPARTAGRITLGCLNNFCKVSLDALETWAQLLNRLDNSRLVLNSSHGPHRDNVIQFMGQRGIASERLEIVGRVSVQEYFRTYHRIDIALDPFPCAGGTTTCDALWMGVPVVTLTGRTAVGRAGVSILSNVGVAELIARTPAEYVQIASDLAGDLPRLARLRATLRDRMQSSPLMDAAGLARGIEQAYRSMWRTWCAARHGE